MGQDFEDIHESLEIAGTFVGPFSKPASIFTAPIRAIRSAPSILRTTATEPLNVFAVDAAHFLLKVSPTSKATFYFAAKELYGSWPQLSGNEGTKQLLSLFSHDEICGVISLMYLFRTIRPLAVKRDSEEWERLQKKLQAHIKLGGVIGSRLQSVGRGNGMYIAGIRVLAQALLLIKRSKEYKDLRRHCDRHKKLFDIKEEKTLFGCSHLQVASIISSNLGYGVNPRKALGTELTGSEINKILSDKQIDETQGWQLSLLVTESLHQNGTFPQALMRQTNSIFGDASKIKFDVPELTANGMEFLMKEVSDLPENAREPLGLGETVAEASGEQDKVLENNQE